MKKIKNIELNKGRLLRVVLFLSLFTVHFSLVAQNKGFINKSEAKNKLVNGLKEGKWIEYFNSSGENVPDTNGAVLYCLTVYKAGKHWGIVRDYNKKGMLLSETPYTNDTINGIKKEYYEIGGKLLFEIPFTGGKINGIEKVYYESGTVANTVPYTRDTLNGVEKWYYESGKLKQEIPYTNGKENGTEKSYYESGTVKQEIPHFDGKVIGPSKDYDKNGKEIDE